MSIHPPFPSPKGTPSAKEPPGILELLGASLAGRQNSCRITVVEMAGEPPRGVAGVPPPAEGSEAMPVNHRARWFSEVEVRILHLLCQHPTLTRVEIAGHLGENPDNSIKFLLKNLVDRFMLDSGPNGYALHVPEGKERNAYCAELAAWLAREHPQG